MEIIDSSIHWFIDSSNHRVIDSSIHRFIYSSIHRFIDSLIHHKIVCATKYWYVSPFHILTWSRLCSRSKSIEYSTCFPLPHCQDTKWRFRALFVYFECLKGSVNLACDEIMFDGSTKKDMQPLKPASLLPPPSSSSSSSSSAASVVPAFNEADTRDQPSRQTQSSIRFDKEDSPFTGEGCSSGRGTRRRSLGYYHGLCCGGRCPASAVAESTIAVHDPDTEDGDKGRSKGSVCGSGCRAVEEALDRIWRHNHPCLVVGLTAGFVVLVIMVLGVTIHSAGEEYMCIPFSQSDTHWIWAENTILYGFEIWGHPMMECHHRYSIRVFFV